jgi:RNA polymerase sigma factor (sigma-70 family)
MAGSPSDQVFQQVHRLFNLGAVGTMSDAQLLDRFVSRRDEAAEAAFEELVIRHGPMVLTVCRSVLHDAHDAEDAFQAAFLVLANRARTIRRSGSIASWLFGVAQRVAIRGKRTLARRRRRDQLVAERTSESNLPAENDPDWEILHDEIEGLPERLRAPIVLCYMQGLTYDAAAERLGLSGVAIRGRLARARERLRRQLNRRGVTVPAGLLVAGAASHVEAVIPVALIQGTVRIALGFMAGNTAAVLARGVLNSMLLNQVRIAAVLLCIGIGTGYGAWRVFGSTHEKGRGNSRQNIAKTQGSEPAVATEPQTTRPSVAYRLTGSVRVEGTGEPVQGGRFTVFLGDVTGSSNPDRSRTVTSGADGQFLVDLPPGQARAWTFQAPAGYWAPGNSKSGETFVLSRTQPIHRRDYVVRRGTVWPFQLVRAAGRRLPGRPAEKPVRGHIRVATENEIFMPEADETGRVNLTLPTEGGTVMAVPINEKPLSRSLASIPILIPLERAEGFRAEAVKTIERIPQGYRLTDDAGRIATIGEPAIEIPDAPDTGIIIAEPGQVQPILVDGKLLIRVVFFDAERVASGSLSGRIVDEAGKPIAGVRVAPAFHTRDGGNREGGVFPDDREHEATTDRDGRFLIGAIPRLDVTGKPSSLSLVVRKDGFGSLETPAFSFQPGPGFSPQALDPIRLEPGVSLSGTVVDPDGRPAEGVWVEPDGGFALRSQFTRTDAAGKFTVRNLPKGMVELSFAYGSLAAHGNYLADGKADGLKVQLRPSDEKVSSPAAKAVHEPPALGRPAPALQVAGWTDGKSRSLVDYRGKIVFLDFWGTWCSACVNGMPSLERLKQKYEPRGVVFLSIHTPGEEIGQIGRFLELKKASFVSAVDLGPGKDDRSRDGAVHNGATADGYGVRGYPTLVMIDRRGNVVFHSGIDTKEGIAAMKAQGKEMGLEESTMTEADFHRLWEAFFGREIEKILNRP